MARKRKAPASAAPPQPEPVQPEPEIEQPDPEENLPTQEEEPEVEEVEEIEVEEEVEEEEEKPENTEEPKNDDVVTDPEKNGQENVENPSNVAVSGEHNLENPSNDAASGEHQANGETGAEEEEEFEEEPIEKLLEPFSKDQLALLIKEAVSKYPDFMESVHKLADADPSHRKIFVHGLGWDANIETLTSVFGKYGEIEDCKVVTDKASGKSKGYGFILYKHRNGARKALLQPQKKIGTRMTSCQLASAGPVQTAPPAAVTTVHTPPVSEYTLRKIYVSNVSAELDPNKLLEFFSKFGDIEEGPLGLDKQTGKPRGFCLFVYKSLESAKKALEEPHKNFEGHTLHCQQAVDGPKHSKSHYNQHTSHQQQQHHHQQQGYYHHSAKKGKYAGSSGTGGGHLMAPSHGTTVGFNPSVAPAAIGQAVAALLATQGAGLGIGNLLGGMGGMNPQGVMPGMSNAGYGGQSGAGGYGGQPGMQGGYGGQPQMGQGGVRPQQGGAPYMGRGH